MIRSMTPTDRALMLELEMVATRRAAVDLVAEIITAAPEVRQRLDEVLRRAEADSARPELARLARLVVAVMLDL
jgi:hypothetical protein